MTSAYLILAALMRLAPATDVDLLVPVAWAIEDTAKTKTEVAFLIAQAKAEGGLRPYVLEGRCHEGPPGARCDNGAAETPWMVHGWCKASRTGNVNQRLRGGARCALQLYRWGDTIGGPACGFQIQGGGGTPTAGECARGARRVPLMWQVRSWL